MNLKADLQKMNLSDLKFICKELGVSYKGDKSNIIKKLLKPLNKKYKSGQSYYNTGDFYRLLGENKIIKIIGIVDGHEVINEETHPTTVIKYYVVNRNGSIEEDDLSDFNSKEKIKINKEKIKKEMGIAARNKRHIVRNKRKREREKSEKSRKKTQLEMLREALGF
tara:strand:- start:472 stop:969 length:498 start_codon:yes stop_codon:yes gene_type:complete